MLAVSAVLLSTPAFADWPPTHWGMTVDEVLEAVPGAVAVKSMNGDDDVMKQRQFASAPFEDGGIPMKAEFYFDRKLKTLSMVRFLPAPAQCSAYDAVVRARYGAGVETGSTTPLIAVAIKWTDAATRDEISYTNWKTVAGVQIDCLLLIRKATIG
jgi:hypothetical protein